jgi:uncharacterized protein YciI
VIATSPTGDRAAGWLVVCCPNKTQRVPARGGRPKRPRQGPPRIGRSFPHLTAKRARCAAERQLMVAGPFKARSGISLLYPRRGATVVRARVNQASLRDASLDRPNSIPWVETHGYRQCAAPRRRYRALLTLAQRARLDAADPSAAERQLMVAGPFKARSGIALLCRRRGATVDRARGGEASLRDSGLDNSFRGLKPTATIIAPLRGEVPLKPTDTARHSRCRAAGGARETPPDTFARGDALDDSRYTPIRQAPPTC